MQRNLAWPILLSILSVLVVVFTSLLTIDLYSYQKLREKALLKDIDASVRKIGPSKYGLEVNYSYQVQGKGYCRHQVLKKKSFKNIWLANQAIERMQQKEIPVWYNPQEPQKGSLDKAFPFSRLLSTVVLLSIFLYFCLLGRYMLKRV